MGGSTTNQISYITPLLPEKVTQKNNQRFQKAVGFGHLSQDKSNQKVSRWMVMRLVRGRGVGVDLDVLDVGSERIKGKVIGSVGYFTPKEYPIYM